MKLTLVLFAFCLFISSILATPLGGESEAIRERRATSFVCSTCPFVCPHGGACLKGNCVCVPQLGPKPGKLPTPVVNG